MRWIDLKDPASVAELRRTLPACCQCCGATPAEHAVTATVTEEQARLLGLPLTAVGSPMLIPCCTACATHGAEYVTQTAVNILAEIMCQVLESN